MNTLSWLITGGFAKGYRTQILGVTTALSAVGYWAAGDMTRLGLAALGAKVDDAAAKPEAGKPSKVK
ncbi:MAG: hypothetical protein ACRECX_10825 [Methyloceanibacter sp.]|uniref:hypothetical protein n=1 Tax=Methyloceanibacter sp. TaxID=1965321 RepID=UPI003D6C808D